MVALGVQKARDLAKSSRSLFVRLCVRPNTNALGLRDGGNETSFPLKSHLGCCLKASL